MPIDMMQSLVLSLELLVQVLMDIDQKAKMSPHSFHAWLVWLLVAFMNCPITYTTTGLRFVIVIDVILQEM